VKIALIQTNPLIGAFDQNVDQALAWMHKARQAGCDMAIFPELAICGYPPQDLLDRPAFVRDHDTALDRFRSQVGSMACVIGALERRGGKGKRLYNSAFVLHEGAIVNRARKRLLPTYDVFDETRYFEPGTAPVSFTYQGIRFGLTVCEDIWCDALPYEVNPISDLLRSDEVPECLINVSASPYYDGKIVERLTIFSMLCRANRLPLLYTNQVGGQDGLVFDGHSMAINDRGRIAGYAAGFQEDMLVVDTKTWQQSSSSIPTDSVGQVLDALTIGVRDYLHKSGFRRAVVGLSGGVDSAITAVIACRALGADNVLCVAMPSPYTAQASIDDARSLAQNLGCGFELVPIAPVMEAYRQTLESLFAGQDENVAEQNIQARIRGNILMAISNKFGSMVLSTGNKSEMAVGYCTLYGDMSGGLAVLADVPKKMVYWLGQYFNRDQPLIPERILTRAPTAELKPDQFDQDDLPPYEVLDPILEAYLEQHMSIAEIVANGFDEAVVRDIIRRIRLNEYKRKQAPLGIKVTSKAFGQGRRYPIVQGYSG
jgi:NAD+ synthase (glutamine-hydrolysing)